MAQYQKRLRGSFDGLLAYIEQSVLQGSISASREGGAAFSENGVRCAVRVYERYSYLGQNRLTLTVTLFGRDDALQLFAAASGGSQAVFLKINTLGEEAFLRDYYLAELTKKLACGPAAEFNTHRFDGASISPQALLDAVEAMPMMAERTLVRVDDVDLFKLPEQAREQYRGIFEDLPDYVCLVFCYDTIEYKPNGQMRKLSDTLKKHAQVVEFQKPSERELCTWIARHFRAEGKLISDKLASYLIFLTGGGMTQLSGEIKKISAYASGEEIQRSDIDAVVTPVLNAQTFDISNAVADGNFQLALTKLQELFAVQAEPIAILGAVGSQIRRLYYAKTLAACGKNQQTFMDLTGNKSSYAANLTFTAARKVPEAFCARAVELCLQADRDMKRSVDDPERLLEVLIATLWQEARRG